MMTREQFKNLVCKLEEAILTKGYRPERVWRLYRVLQGDLTPLGSTPEIERWYFSRRPRKKLVVGTIAPPRRRKRRNTAIHGHCIECGSPLSKKRVCETCGTDNYWYIQLGLTKEKRG